MYLVRHQMAKLQHVGVPDNRFLIERFPGPTIKKTGLAVSRQPGFQEVLLDTLLLDAIKNRRRNLDPEFLRRPAEMGLEHLADIHAGRHAQGIEDEIHRGSILEVRHIFLGNDLGHDTLVAVATRYLVTHRQLALGGDENPYRLDHTRVDLITGSHAPCLFLVLGL